MKFVVLPDTALDYGEFHLDASLRFLRRGKTFYNRRKILSLTLSFVRSPTHLTAVGSFFSIESASQEFFRITQTRSKRTGEPIWDERRKLLFDCFVPLAVTRARSKEERTLQTCKMEFKKLFPRRPAVEI